MNDKLKALRNLRRPKLLETAACLNVECKKRIRKKNILVRFQEP